MTKYNLRILINKIFKFLVAVNVLEYMFKAIELSLLD